MGFASPTFLFTILLFLIGHHSVLPSLAQVQCGINAGGKVCDGGICCSQFGYCGTTADYCGSTCQSQCTGTPSTPSGNGVGSIVTSSIFDLFFNHRSDGNCPANGFYTYDAFLQATGAYSSFGTSGDINAQKRELAAFFANTAHEVTGGCYKEEIDQSNDYCSASAQWPCAAGKKYYGRGPIQISWNFNYGPAGQALGFDGINNPDIVASDPTISFKTALWFWMTAQSPKPSCHDAIVNNQGFGETINIINGGLECGSGTNTAAQQSRITLYQQYCQILGVDPGSNLTC